MHNSSGEERVSCITAVGRRGGAIEEGFRGGAIEEGYRGGAIGEGL